jgi:cysteine desulfurase/selenocysteine lyase
MNMNKVQAECPDYYFLPKSMYNSSTNYDVQSIRGQFPILRRKVNGKPLIWLDNSATTQKPQCVIDTLNQYYSEYNSNVHRGAHTLSEIATDALEAARKKVQVFIGASLPEEIIFLRGTTEAINLIAQAYGNQNINSGDEIILTTMEHHSNIVPWQELAKRKGAVIKVAPINDKGEIILEEYQKLFTPRTRMVAIAHVSNVLGTVNPVRTMIEIAHANGVRVLIDGAQSVPHLRVNVAELGTDFYVFSGHKIYGPTGIGVLYGKKALLEKMPPWQTGGGMIKDVSFSHTTYNHLPHKFEAGTSNIAGAIGLGSATDFMMKIGMENVEHYEKKLTDYSMQAMSEIPGLKIIGTSPTKTSVLSFLIDNVSPDAIARSLDQEGIAVRVGHHCAQPVMKRFGVDGTIRASLGLYNTKEEVDVLVNVLYKMVR